MKKNFLFAICMAVIILFGGCEFHDHHPPHNSYRGYDYSADYCDDYPSGTCCGWFLYSTHHADCYEEWCTWGFGWEYDGEYCY